MKEKSPKEKLLLTMYRSVERMNKHYQNGNSHGVNSERSLQMNLRHNFNEVSR